VCVGGEEYAKYNRVNNLDGLNNVRSSCGDYLLTRARWADGEGNVDAHNESTDKTTVCIKVESIVENSSSLFLLLKNRLVLQDF